MTQDGLNFQIMKKNGVIVAIPNQTICWLKNINQHKLKELK